MMPMIFVTLGNSRKTWVLNVLTQLGSAGCKRAHERRVIAGCAGATVGAADAREMGREDVVGNRIGDLKDGYFSCAIVPMLSRTWSRVGHGR